MRSLRMALAVCMLTACGESATRDAATPPGGSSGSALQALCVDSACGRKQRLITIPDAENLIFDPSGRLFVSGGQNVYRVQASSGGYTATPLSVGTCNFTGLAVQRATLYAACFDGRLFAAPLGDFPVLTPIYQHTGALNGLAAYGDHQLFAADGPTSQAPKIVRLDLSFSDPLQVQGEAIWLDYPLASGFPNGVQVRGTELFYSISSATAPGEIRATRILVDASAGDTRRVASLDSLPDDFSVFADGRLLVTYYDQGKIGLFGSDGALLQSTLPASFDSPSQVRVAQGGDFPSNALLVTEKGVIGEQNSNNGNVLSLFVPN